MIDRDILLRVLAAKARRHDEVARLLEMPELTQDHVRVRTLSRELGQLREFARLHGEIVRVRREALGAREMGADAEFADLAAAELKRLEAREAELWTEAEAALADEDELGNRDVILEIRAGVGGDEAALFAGDLVSMYGYFCGRHRLQIEVLGESPGEKGGYKEVIAQITGPGAYDLLRYEAGVHRVQRVPKTETQGRIHTSAATVAVLPKAEEVDVAVDWDKEVREDKMRAGGPGGQKVNKTESAIRLTHLATGISVHMQDEKSQHKNRARAREILVARIFDHFKQKADAARSAQRRGMIGSGDRSAKIRTYNFPQNRATDHRIEFSVHDLGAVLQGRLEPFHERLRLEEREERLRDVVERLEQGGPARGPG